MSELSSPNASESGKLKKIEEILKNEKFEKRVAATRQILRTNPSPEDWKIITVLQWLEAIGLTAYIPTFEAAGIDGPKLMDLEEDDLKTQVGVTSDWHLQIIVEMLSTLKTLRKERARNVVHYSEEREDSKEKKKQESKKRLQAKLDFWTPVLREHGTTSTSITAKKKISPASSPSSSMRPSSARKSLSSNRPASSPSALSARKRSKSPPRDESVRSASASPKLSQRQRQSTSPSSVGGKPHPPLEAMPEHKTVSRRRRPSTGVPSNAGKKTDAERAWERVHKSIPPILEKLREKYGPKRRVDLRPPQDRMTSVMHAIRDAEARGAIEEMLNLWLEYGCLARIAHGDLSPVMVNAEFHIGTCYLRQRMIKQASHHFILAKESNERMPGTAGNSFMPRIYEGLGICETRQGNYSQGQTYLDKAKDINDSCNGADHPSGASILVAKSELFSAKGDHQEALDCLQSAFKLKEAEVGSDHVQIGKLYQAMARVRQRQLMVINSLLTEVNNTLSSALDVKDEFEQTRKHRFDSGDNAMDPEEEARFSQLIDDINDMRMKHAKLKETENTAKTEALNFLCRGYQTFVKVLGDSHPVALAAAQSVWETAKEYEQHDVMVEYSFARPTKKSIVEEENESQYSEDYEEEEN